VYLGNGVQRGRLDSASSRKGSKAGSCAHGNEPSVSIQDKGLIEHLRDYQFRKKDSTTRSESYSNSFTLYTLAQNKTVMTVALFAVVLPAGPCLYAMLALFNNSR